jgi:hypothetical protein
VSEVHVEVHLGALVLRTSDWPIGILALLGIDFGKHSSNSQNIRKNANVTSADVLSRSHGQETGLVKAMSHLWYSGIPAKAKKEHDEVTIL